MKVLIKPTITINPPVKNKCFGFKIILTKKDTEQLTVKASSHGGRSRGVVGKITRGGSFIMSNNYKYQAPVITPSVQNKIDVLLDLLFGKTRDAKVEIGKKGMVQFKHNK